MKTGCFWHSLKYSLSLNQRINGKNEWQAITCKKRIIESDVILRNAWSTHLRCRGFYIHLVGWWCWSASTFKTKLFFAFLLFFFSFFFYFKLLRALSFIRKRSLYSPFQVHMVFDSEKRAYLTYWTRTRRGLKGEN